MPSTICGEVPLIRVGGIWIYFDFENARDCLVTLRDYPHLRALSVPRLSPRDYPIPPQFHPHRTIYPPPRPNAASALSPLGAILTAILAHTDIPPPALTAHASPAPNARMLSHPSAIPPPLIVLTCFEQNSEKGREHSFLVLPIMSYLANKTLITYPIILILFNVMQRYM